MDLNQFLLALRARRKAFVIALAATIVTAIAVALIVPKKYVATATLLMDARDEQTMSPARMSPRERAELPRRPRSTCMQSSRVADAGGARPQARAEARRARSLGEATPAASARSTTGSPTSLLEKLAGRHLGRATCCWSTSRRTTRSFAAEVANGFAKAYLDTALQLRTEPTREAAEWFDEQLKTLRTQVVQAQTRLNTYQKQKGILSRTSASTSSRTRLAELSTQLLAARNATYDALSRHKQATEIAGERRLAARRFPRCCRTRTSTA